VLYTVEIQWPKHENVYLVESHGDQKKYQYSTDNSQHYNPSSYTAFRDLPEKPGVNIHVIWSVSEGKNY
jgi:hypothetical protein